MQSRNLVAVFLFSTLQNSLSLSYKCYVARFELHVYNSSCNRVGHCNVVVIRPDGNII